MKGKRLTAALAAALAVTAIGAGTAAATGAFSSHHSTSTERALTAALRDREPKNVIFLLGDGMGTQEITAARYYQGVNQRPQRRPHAVHRLRHHLVGQAGRQRALLARLRPRLGLDRHGLGYGCRKRSTSASRRARAATSSVPGKNLTTVLELAQKRGMKVGDVSTAEITDATPAVLASHISLRGCQGPADMARLPAGDEGGRRSRLDRRAGDRPQGRRAARWRPRPLRADDSRRSRRRQDPGPGRPGKGLPLRHRRRRPQHGLERQQTGAWSLQQKQHVAGVDRAGRRDRQGQRRGGLHRGPAPGQRAEPGGDDQAGDRPARRRQAEGLLPPGRGGLDRQAGPRHQRLRPDRRDGRLRPGDRDRARLPGRSPGHAGRRHRRPRPHEPDRRRGRNRRGHPDRVLDQPPDQGRSDPEPHLRNRRLRRPGCRSGRGAAEPAAHRRGCAGLGLRPRLARRCWGPTTTPTCSRRWGADLGQARRRRAGPTRPSFVRAD